MEGFLVCSIVMTARTGMLGLCQLAVTLGQRVLVEELPLCSPLGGFMFAMQWMGLQELGEGQIMNLLVFGLPQDSSISLPLEPMDQGGDLSRVV